MTPTDIPAGCVLLIVAVYAGLVVSVLGMTLGF